MIYPKGKNFAKEESNNLLLRTKTGWLSFPSVLIELTRVLGLLSIQGQSSPCQREARGRRISVGSMQTPGTSLKALRGHGLQQWFFFFFFLIWTMQRIEVLIPGQECSWAGWCEALGDSESVVKPWSAKINKNERKKWYIIVWKVKSSGEASPQSKAQWLLVQHSCPDWKFISPRWLKQSFSLRHKGSSKDSYGCKCYTKSPSSFFFIGVYSKMNQLYIYTYIHIHTYTYIYLLYLDSFLI